MSICISYFFSIPKSWTTLDYSKSDWTYDEDRWPNPLDLQVIEGCGEVFSGHFALQAVLHPDAGNLEMNRHEVSGERMDGNPLARSDEWNSKFHISVLQSLQENSQSFGLLTNILFEFSKKHKGIHHSTFISFIIFHIEHQGEALSWRCPIRHIHREGLWDHVPVSAQTRAPKKSLKITRNHRSVTSKL